MSTSFNPLWPWSLLLLAGGGGLLLAVWFAWRGASTLSRTSRIGLLTLRCLAILGILALLSNPGRWETKGDAEPPGWALLFDRSGSMATTDEEGKARLEVARSFATTLIEGSAHPERVRRHLYDETLGEEWETTGDVVLSGNGTRLDRAGLGLLDRATEEGSRWTGLVVVGDGRQTGGEGELETLASRARALGIPIHTVPLGAKVTKRDVAVTVTRRQFVTLPNQTVTVIVRVANEGLAPVAANLRLVATSSGDEHGTLAIEVKTGETVSGEFTLPPDSPAGEYKVIMAPLPGDENPGNDESGFTLRILEKRTRVFLVEGAPYWDTKFLAQLLRGQGLMDVDAVYRIRPDRFYKVATGETAVLQETTEVFPDTDAALGHYDLVVIGKGAEAFLTPERIERLSRFVRDRGGALLFSRGKPYAGNFEGLASLEPGLWGEETGAEYTFLPTGDGEESGLFGERLPGIESAVWSGLSPLEDVRTMAELRPFTRVLAVGNRVGGGAKVPLLVARRHGRGMVAAVNGDGLWRWGFNPGKEEGEDWYREFWMQMLQWTATYSEFLPGEDFSLQLSSGIAESGETVRARIGYRGGTNPAPVPMVELSGPAPESLAAAPAGSAEDGNPRWGVVLSPKEPGSYLVELHAGGEPGPAVPLTILPPPQETDELSSHREVMEQLSAATEGRVWSTNQGSELLALLEPEKASVVLEEAEWVPLWNQPWLLGVIVVLLGAEWAGRRRLGLL